MAGTFESHVKSQYECHGMEIVCTFAIVLLPHILKGVRNPLILLYEAAIETVSKLVLPSHKGDLLIDIRKVRLPTNEDDKESLTDTGAAYDPMSNRTPVTKIKVWMAYFNLLRSIFGPGMMAMPLIISQLGIIVGPILTIAVGFLIVYTHNMLLDCLYEVARQLKIPYISYRYGFRIALLNGPIVFHGLAEKGPTIIAIFMLFSQLAMCTVCVIFTTDGFRDFFDIQHRDIALLCLIIPYLVLQVFMSNLMIVSYVAMIGNVLNLVGMLLMLEHILFDHSGEVTTSLSLMSFLFSFGSLLFVLSAVGVILSLDKSLEDPRRLKGLYGALSVGILFPSFIAVIFGTLGYMAFGTMEENVLRSLPFDEVTAMAAIGIYSVSVASGFPLQCHPAIMVIVEVIKYRYEFDDPLSARTLEIIRNISRPVLVLTCFLISHYIPFQGPFVAFVGNLCTSMLSLVFPALMDICLRYPSNYGKANYRLYIDLFILGLGLLSLLFGVYLCSYLIYVRILSKNAANYSGFV